MTHQTCRGSSCWLRGSASQPVDYQCGLCDVSQREPSLLLPDWNEHLSATESEHMNLLRFQLYMSPEAEHILDWFHLSMKPTVLDQYGKGLMHCDAGLGEEIREKIARLKWSLWHGNLSKAFSKID